MPRYRSLAQHLDPAVGPKRILALDGGGLRGVLTLGILRELESTLRAEHGDEPSFRLGHYFDLIAGTSTGAIIAAALALGMSVDEVHGHYMRLGEFVFKRSLLRRGVVQAKYDGKKVAQSLRGVYGDRRLDSPDFLTGLMVVTKRLDTGSTWPITNNPQGQFFSAGEGESYIPNGHYPLWQVVRASTAAPTFFDPEQIEIGLPEAGKKPVVGQFVDGGVSPHNNPSLAALMTATMDGYRLRWPAAADQLLLVSVGTGKANAERGRSAADRLAVGLAVGALSNLMEDCADQVEAMMQWLSHSPTARPIDLEMGTACPPLGGAALCTYLRYNVLFRDDWCAKHLGERFTPEQLKSLEAMDEPDNIGELDRIGRLAGKKLVHAQHFPAAFRLS